MAAINLAVQILNWGDDRRAAPSYCLAKRRAPGKKTAAGNDDVRVLLSAVSDRIRETMPYGRAVMVWLAIFAMIVAAAIFALYTVAYAYFQELEIQQARNRSALYQTTLTDALERYQHLPLVLSEDPQIAGALFGVNVERINRRLARIADRKSVV